MTPGKELIHRYIEAFDRRGTVGEGMLHSDGAIVGADRRPQRRFLNARERRCGESVSSAPILFASPSRCLPEARGRMAANFRVRQLWEPAVPAQPAFAPNLRPAC